MIMDSKKFRKICIIDNNPLVIFIYKEGIVGMSWDFFRENTKDIGVECLNEGYTVKTILSGKEVSIRKIEDLGEKIKMEKNLVKFVWEK